MGEQPGRRPATGRRSCVRRSDGLPRRPPTSEGPPQDRWTRGRHAKSDETTVALNRRARHDFSIDETFEAGIVLTGTEIKSLRAGKANLSDAYASIEHGEAWLVGAHIAPFEQGNRYNHEPKRTRKLLLHRSEIDELLGRTKAKGQTIVPLRLYISTRGRAKVELGLARGKQQHDRRRDIAERDARRDIDRELADAQRGR